MPPFDYEYAQLSVGLFHACAVRVADGNIACWGSDDAGQLQVR